LDLTPVSQGSVHLQEEDEILAIAEFLINEIQSELSTDLLKEEYRIQHETEDVHPQTGHCYVASEALYWLLGGPNTDLFTPVVGRIEGESHWAIRYNREGQNDLYFDPTSDQFGGLSREDHAGMTGTGFMSRQPSKRCRKLLVRIRKELFPAWEPDGHPGILDEYAESGGSKAYSGPSSSSGDPEKPEEGGDEGEGWFVKKDYKYSRLSDTYIFQLSTYSGAALTVDGELIREIVRRYSNYDDEQQTINQIATEVGIPREAFKEIKTDLGITHDSPPRTDEEFEEILGDDGSVEELAQDDVQQAKWKWRENYDKKRYNDLKRQAAKWQNRREEIKRILEGQSEQVADWAPDYDPPAVNFNSQADEKGALVLPIHDLHYGKYALEEECGADYNREIARDRAESAVRKVLEEACRLRDIEKIYTVCGTSDYLHIDQDKPPSTTAGTPQDTDGTIGEIVSGGQKLAVELIDIMRSVAPTEVIYCEGNHDRVGGLHMHGFLRAWYRDSEDVSFSKTRRHRQYFQYGPTSGCIHHGEIKKSQLKELGTVIARENGFNKYTMAISGHKHFRKAEDKSGLLLHQCLSLSGSDRWHDRNMYKSLPGLQGFVLDRGDGPIATPTYYI